MKIYKNLVSYNIARINIKNFKRILFVRISYHIDFRMNKSYFAYLYIFSLTNIIYKLIRLNHFIVTEFSYEK